MSYSEVEILNAQKELNDWYAATTEEEIIELAKRPTSPKIWVDMFRKWKIDHNEMKWQAIEHFDMIVNAEDYGG
jgi:hypothetical protein